MKKKLLILLCFLVVYEGASQTKSISNCMLKNKMEYFTIEKYKDWEIDTDHSSSENRKFLKKDNERVQILFDIENIQVERTSILNPYKKVQVFRSLTKNLYAEGIEFYQIWIGIDKDYDEVGKVIEERDNDKPYIFTLQQLIGKIKKEYDVDLEDLTQRASVTRSIDSILKKPIYEVYLPSKENPVSKRNYFLIDGITGELIHTKTYFKRRDEAINPFNEYILSLRKKEIEDNSFYKSYKGKNYTKKEWEAFEEE